MGLVVKIDQRRRAPMVTIASTAMVTNSIPPVTDALRKEVVRLEKIAALFEKSHSVHHGTVLGLIHSIEQHLKCWNQVAQVHAGPRARVPAARP